MRKRMTAALLFAFLVGAVSFAQAADDKVAGKTIAVVPKSLANPFFVAMSDSVKDAAAKYGINAQIQAPSESTDVDKQISILETFITQGVDAIVCGPCSSTAIVDVIIEADKKGIPFFLIDSGADESPYVSYVATNNFEGGRMAARWMAENVKEGDVAILDGFAGNDACTQRQKGFMEEIANYPKIKVVASEYGNAEVAKAMEVMENFLTAYPNLKGVFAVTDNMAIGAGSAVGAAGKRSQVKILGFDGQPNAAEMIMAGSIDATLAQKPMYMGVLTVEQIVKHFKGEKFPRFTDTGCDVVDITNAKEYLDWH